MKNSGVCPKCESADIIRLRGPAGGSGNNIMTGFRGDHITCYVCYRCGFSEEWIESRAALERLRDKHGYARDDPAAPASGMSIQRELGLS